jgi:hypothetical protein
LFGPSRYQGGGHPTGLSIVKDLLKEAAPAIARMPDPAKTRNLLRLDCRLLELYVSPGRAIVPAIRPLIPTKPGPSVWSER